MLWTLLILHLYIRGPIIIEMNGFKELAACHKAAEEIFLYVNEQRRNAKYFCINMSTGESE